jgi:hypothetical protein
MDVTLQYFDGCPSWQQAETRLRAALDRTGHMDVEITRQVVASHDEAKAIGFTGSPTILLDGRDAFPEPEAPIGLLCRLYETGDGLRGSPSMDQLVEAIHRAARSRGFWRRLAGRAGGTAGARPAGAG